MSYYEWATSGDLEAVVRDYVKHQTLDARKMRLATCALTREHYVFGGGAVNFEEFAKLLPLHDKFVAGDWSEFDTSLELYNGVDNVVADLYHVQDALLLLQDIDHVERCIDGGESFEAQHSSFLLAADRSPVIGFFALTGLYRSNVEVDALGTEIALRIFRDVFHNPFSCLSLRGRPVDCSYCETSCKQCDAAGGNVPLAARTNSYVFDESLCPRFLITCPHCKGRGVKRKKKCKVCHGRFFEKSNLLTEQTTNLARTAYDSGDYRGRLNNEQLVILAEVLEDMGLFEQPCLTCAGEGRVLVGDGLLTTHPCPTCATPLSNKGTGQQMHELLCHLRDPGPHWRGCWALDLFLEDLV